MFYGWTFGSERRRERTANTGEREKITVNTATYSHTQARIYTIYTGAFGQKVFSVH